jgi:hypothetical protein
MCNGHQMISELTQTTCAYSWPMLIINNISNPKKGAQP